uniref:Uncharacterized protein n=1 Tax=Timema douglasi TaxID=61478 RepID=A0A7R8VGL6_TIMDO|nr:unnamed protein product [Timema douglasi]
MNKYVDVSYFQPITAVKNLLLDGDPAVYGSGISAFGELQTPPPRYGGDPKHYNEVCSVLKVEVHGSLCSYNALDSAKLKARLLFGIVTTKRTCLVSEKEDDLRKLIRITDMSKQHQQTAPIFSLLIYLFFPSLCLFVSPTVEPDRNSCPRPDANMFWPETRVICSQQLEYKMVLIISNKSDSFRQHSLTENHPISPERESNLDLPVLGSLSLHETSALVNYAIEAAKRLMNGAKGLNRRVFPNEVVCSVYREDIKKSSECTVNA